ncbi:MAG: crossover junction endodeoxyribonuclease RuvC [Phycisphaerales bacterium]|jgi:crossover junction endodeoxyribonuclease RuvC
MRVLGLDPGLRLTGYACVAMRDGRDALDEAGVLRLKRGDASPDGLATRLVELEADLRDLIERLQPDAACVEAVFAHKAFPATAISMGHARGVILLTAKRAGLPIVELSPAVVKRSMTGFGRATKDQMRLAVQARYNLPEPPTPADVADAIAIAAGGLLRHAQAGLTPLP